MIKKIFSIAGRIFVGVYLFYLFVCLVVIPIVAPSVASRQASRLLGHDVQLKSVSINPFLWRVSLRDLSVFDSDKTVMAGFNRLTMDASFVRLLAREYRVESIELTGLRINAVLRPGGSLNLVSLIPAKPVESPAVAPPVSLSPATTSDGKLPLIVIDTVTLHNGLIQLTDQSVTPPFTAVLDHMELRVDGCSTDPSRQAKASFHGRLNEKGLIATEAVFKPLAVPLELETSMALNGYALQVLTPYAGKYTGRKIKDGVLDVKMTYRIGDRKLTASHKILIQRFGFGDKVPSPDALGLPFGLAVALLEDPQGRINISLPVTGDMSDPQFHYWHMVRQVARNFFVKLLTKPFAFLASSVGLTSDAAVEEDLGNIRFVSGEAQIMEKEQEKLKAIVEALKDRPRVSLEIKGSYDPQLDWRAIKAQVFETNYKTLREESKRRELEVYKQLYQRRFGLKELWVVARRFRLPDGSYDQENFMAEIKKRLVEDGSADQLALQALAERRAQAIYQYLSEHGFDPKRMTTGGAVLTTQGMDGQVPLELVLNVLDGTAAGPPVNNPQR